MGMLIANGHFAFDKGTSVGLDEQLICFQDGIKIFGNFKDVFYKSTKNKKEASVSICKK